MSFRSSFRWHCALALTFSFLISPLKAAAADTRWGPTLEFGGKTGNERSLWELDFTLPVHQTEESLLFLDVRGRQDNDSSEEGNFGLAYRHRLGEGIAGVYGFYDLLHSQYGNTYHQGTLGAEYMAASWELRANGYVPEAGRRSTGRSAASGAQLNGSQISVLTGGDERAMPGYDLEAGARVPFTDQDIWLRAAFFHFNASGFEDVTGPRIGAEWGIGLDRVAQGAKLTLGAEWQTDGVRGSMGFASARMRIPLGSRTKAAGSTAGWRHARMQQKIRRDVDVVVGEQKQEEQPAVDPMTGRPFGDVVFAASDADSDGAGTLEDPAMLEYAPEIAGPGGVVVALGGDREGFETDGVYLDDVHLVGGGSTLMVGGAGGGSAGLVLPGERPTLYREGGDSDAAINIGGGSVRIQGLDVYDDREAIRTDHYSEDGTDSVHIVDVNAVGRGYAVILSDVADVRIESSRFEAQKGGIRLDGVTNATVIDSVVEGADTAISIEARPGARVDVSGNRVSGVSYGGIRVYGEKLESKEEPPALQVRVVGNTLSSGGEGETERIGEWTGIEVGGQGLVLDVAGNTVTGFTRTGIAVSANRVSGRIDGNTLGGYDGDEDTDAPMPRVGIDVSASEIDLDVSGNRVEDTYADGILIVNHGDPLDLRVRNNVLVDTNLGRGGSGNIVLSNSSDDAQAVFEGNHVGGDDVEDSDAVISIQHHGKAAIRLNGCSEALSIANGGLDARVDSPAVDGAGVSCGGDKE